MKESKNENFKKIMQLSIDRGYDVMRKVHALESKGVDVVHLEIGEPDFDTPKNICDAAIEAAVTKKK